jgi:2,3-bisphosphoglycerate-dependent phosphoglycerate mutase
MRHANSAANADNSVNAEMPDHKIPLVPSGPAQARAAGRAFDDFVSAGYKIRSNSMRLWHSTYLRADMTAHEMLLDMGESFYKIKDIYPSIFLTEQRFGLFDGLSEDEKAARFPDQYADFKKWEENGGKFYARMPQGESRYDVAMRAHQFFGTIIRDAEKPRNNVPNVFIVSHGTTIRAFVMMWLHRNPEWFDQEPNPNNCSIRHLARGPSGRWEDRGYIFDGFPDQEALRKAGEKVKD